VPAGPPSCAGLPPLAGFSVGVTADRRRDEQAELLRRAGARVVHAPLLKALTITAEGRLRATTEAVIESPPHIVLVTTGIGVRTWMAAAETWDLEDQLLDALTHARIYARGPKAAAAITQLGLLIWKQEPTEQLRYMIDDVVQHGVGGRRVLLQQFGEPSPWAVDRLAGAGAEVNAVTVYEWSSADDVMLARRFVSSVAAGMLDAITFTSPPAVAAFRRFAEEQGSLARIQRAMRHPLAVACVGPVTAAAASEAGFTPACWPQRGRLGLMVKSLKATMHDRHVHLRTDRGQVIVQGHLITAPDDGLTIELSVIERQLVAALADRPGVVVPRTELARRAWGSPRHAASTVESGLSRLRQRLRPLGLEVVSRPRRGYVIDATRLDCEAAGG
jgi:uroporphyrinogen-III synthase